MDYKTIIISSTLGVKLNKQLVGMNANEQWFYLTFYSLSFYTLYSYNTNWY